MCLQKYVKDKIVVVGSLVGSVVTICGIAVVVNQALVVPPREAMEMKLDVLNSEVLNNRGAMEVEVGKATLHLEDKIRCLDNKMENSMNKMEKKMSKMENKMDKMEINMENKMKKIEAKLNEVLKKK
jgi:hypothetical protein